MGLADPTDSPAVVVVRKTMADVARNVKWMCTLVKMDFGIKKDISMGAKERGEAVGACAEAILTRFLEDGVKSEKIIAL